MAFLDQVGMRLRSGRDLLEAAGRSVSRYLPKGLYARSILIVVLPIVILQSVVAYVFMERHWQLVTRRLSSAVSKDVAAVVDMVETYGSGVDYSDIERIARTMGLRLTVLPPGPLPDPAPRPFFSLLDRTLSDQLSDELDHSFWLDTVGNSDMVEIRVPLDDSTLRIFASRNQAYASNSHIFLVWMVCTSLVLISIALLFLRNQIRPILLLGRAAERFGKGRPVEDFRPRGAREVRQAAQAFIDMRERIERQIEQRTTMLSGVSHDLRTILTRFQLEVAMLDDTRENEALRSDIDEMSRMLEDYMAFAQGDAGESSGIVDLETLIEEVAENARRGGREVETSFSGDPEADLREVSFRRSLANLVGNAEKYASRIRITGEHGGGWVTITVEDNGPGIPVDEREAVFRPFYRLDSARNVDSGGTGLGLAIARDVAMSHGGDITLDESPLGGLRAVLRVPA